MRSLCAGLICAVLLPAMPRASSAGEPQSVRLGYQWLVGYPDPQNPDGSSVILIPGTVIMSGETWSPAQRDEAILLRRIDSLKVAYRLARIEPTAAPAVEALAVNETRTLGGSGSPISAECALVTADERQFTLGLKLMDGGKTLAEPKISIRRGGHAVLGSRDGEAAPYVFLVLRDASSLTTSGGRIAKQPKLISRISPEYPSEARRKRIEGVVRLDCTLGVDGSVTKAVPVGDSPQILAEAAVEAVRQWKYEPVLDANGKAVGAVLTVTVWFKLSKPTPTPTPK